MVRRPKPPPKAQIPPFDIGRLKAAARATVNLVQMELLKFAEAEAGVFRRRIERQRFDSFKEKPLAESTLAKKMRYARSLRVMMSTGTYAAGIRALVTQTSNGRYTVRIGHANRLRARDTVTGRPRHDVAMSKVAFWQEFGAPRAGIPARPHWGPAMEAARKRAPAEKKRIRSLAVAQFKRMLRRK